MKNKTKVLITLTTALLLGGCGDRSLSGTYVSHQASGAELMHLTQTPDHHLTGTIQYATLMNDGNVSTSTVNVSGVVDGDNLTLTIYSTPLPLGQNFGGTVTGSGLDFTLPATGSSAQAKVSHFDRDTVQDYDAMVAKLSEAGSAIANQRQSEQQVASLNRDAEALARDLDTFVARARQIQDHTPRMIAFYARAVTVEQTRLAHAQRLAATGNNVQIGQAQVEVGQMGVDRSQIEITGSAIADAQKELAKREAALNAGIARFNGICLGDTSAVKVGAPIPDMGPCKVLSRAYAAYRSVLGPVDAALASAAQAKADADQRLSAIMHTATDIR
ncbi:hypothetical protein PQR34_43880 [Paraburkholderia sediminicola]|uniref:hypothetical protein n=1 Tax=Paraburkholderia sediminicola TaxID=458836 RepID=UPI0038BC7728